MPVAVPEGLNSHGLAVGDGVGSTIHSGVPRYPLLYLFNVPIIVV